MSDIEIPFLNVRNLGKSMLINTQCSVKRSVKPLTRKLFLNVQVLRESKKGSCLKSTNPDYVSHYIDENESCFLL